MTDTPEPSDDRSLEHLIEAYLEYLDGAGPEPTLTELSGPQRAEAQELLTLIDASWGSHLDMPPLEEDPVAIALGFAPQPIPVIIAGPRLKSVRQQNHLDARQLTEAIRALGGDLSIADVVRLERLPAYEIPASTAAVLADALEVNLKEIADPSHLDGFVAWLYSKEFEQAVAAWAADEHQDREASTREARQRLLSASRRSAGQVARTGWHTLLQAVLEAMR